MKLKFIKKDEGLNEAKGLTSVEKVYQKIKSEIESSGYNFTADKNKGFFITGKNKYLVKLILTKNGNAFDVAAVNNVDAKLPLSINSISLDEKAEGVFNKLIANEIVTAIPSPSVVASSISENINEDRVAKLSAKLAAATASQALKELKNLANIFEELINKNEIIKKSKLNITTDVKNNTITFYFNCNFILGVQFSEAPLAGNMVGVKACITPFGIKTFSRTVNVLEAVEFIEKQLNITIDMDDEDILKTIGANDTQKTAVKTKNQNIINDKYVADLINAIGNDNASILTSTSEAVDNKDCDKYDDVLEKVAKDANKVEALVKLYIYKKTNIKIDDALALKSIVEYILTNGFSTNINTLLYVVMEYIDKNKEITALLTEFLDANAENKKFIDFLEKTKTNGLYYNKKLLENNADIGGDELYDILEKYYYICNKTDISEENKTKLASKFSVDVATLDTGEKIADLIVFKDKANFKIRLFNNIKIGFAIIMKKEEVVSKVDPADDVDDEDDEEISTSDSDSTDVEDILLDVKKGRKISDDKLKKLVSPELADKFDDLTKEDLAALTAIFKKIAK